MKQNVFRLNSYYEGLIQNLYSGSKGCFSAFMHFFYQYNQCGIFHREFCACFEELYQNELTNCQILSEVLIRLGGDNKYYSSSRQFLSGYNVDYIKNLSKIFLLDVEILEIHIIETKNVTNKIENNEIKNMIKRILENKKKSLKILKENYFKNNLIN